MRAFEIAFEITAGANGIRDDAYIRLGIGVAVLIAGIAGFILGRRIHGRYPKTLSTPTFLTCWGALWLLVHSVLWKIDADEINHLLDVHRSEKCEIVEGIVHVTHEQPATGHAAGDKINIGDSDFEVDYFRVTPGYKQTLSHGGVLRDGVFARIHHYNGRILKVEISTE